MPGAGSSVLLPRLPPRGSTGRGQRTVSVHERWAQWNHRNPAGRSSVETLIHLEATSNLTHNGMSLKQINNIDISQRVKRVTPDGERQVLLSLRGDVS